MRCNKIMVSIWRVLMILINHSAVVLGVLYGNFNIYKFYHFTYRILYLIFFIYILVLNYFKKLAHIASKLINYKFLILIYSNLNNFLFKNFILLVKNILNSGITIFDSFFDFYVLTFNNMQYLIFVCSLLTTCNIVFKFK